MPIDYVPEAGPVEPAFSLESLQAIDENSVYIERDNGVEAVRREALLAAGLEIGAQGGLLSRSSEINRFLEETKDILDRQFPFHPLLIDGEILPPVILSSRQAVTMGDNGKTLRVADAMYSIKQDARFVTAAPTWRDYLSMPQAGVRMPHRSVAPKTDAEKRVWHQAVGQGWRSGVAQADEIYELALNELSQDFLGMVTYRKLLSEGKVSKPNIERNNLGVTGNGREMVIGDRVKEITEESSLQIHRSYDWNVPVLPDEKPAVRSQGKSVQDMRIEVLQTNPEMAARDVKKTLSQWVLEWTAGDSDDYLTYYADDFMLPDDMSRKAWEASRKASIGRTDVIKVKLNDLKVVVSEDNENASVSFKQRYTFDQYNGIVGKVMLLEMDDHGQWKIAYEAESTPRQALPK